MKTKKKNKPAPKSEIKAALSMTSKAHKQQQLKSRQSKQVSATAKQKRDSKRAVALAAHAETVESAEFKADAMPSWLRAAHDYERSANSTPVVNSKFKIGDVVILERQRCVCFRVNDCRACFTSANLRSVAFDTVSGKSVDFVATQSNTISISPNAEVDVVESLGADWKEKLLARSEQPKDTMKNTEKSDKRGARSARSASAKKSELNPIGAKVLASGHISLSGRSDYIAQLVAEGITDLDEVVQRVKERWPTHASRVHIQKTLQSKIAKAKAK